MCGVRFFLRKPYGLLVLVTHCFQLLFAFMLGNFFASFLFKVTHDKFPSLNISYENIFPVNHIR